MGLFKWFKREFLEVIEWKDDTRDTVAWKFPNNDRKEIMNSSTLVVRPGQVAIFVHKGQIADIFTEGTYKLASENIPFLTTLLSLPTLGDSPIKADVHYVSTRKFAGMKWGTQNPIMMRDAEFGNIRLRGYGAYTFKVIDPKMFLRDMASTASVLKVSDVEGIIKPMVVSALTDAIAESKISALDLASNYEEFGVEVEKSAKKNFEEYGLSLTDMVFENLSLPEEVEKALDERTRLGVLESKLGTYTRLKVADAIGDSAKNEGGNNMAGLGVGLGAGNVMGQVLGGNIDFSNPTVKEKAAKGSSNCSNCGHNVKEGVKFCPECGEKMTATCPHCKAQIAKGAKFCSECGKSVSETACGKCGAKMRKNAKFCPECGEKRA